jgi:hypothetical protein
MCSHHDYAHLGAAPEVEDLQAQLDAAGGRIGQLEVTLATVYTELEALSAELRFYQYAPDGNLKEDALIKILDARNNIRLLLETAQPSLKGMFRSKEERA